MVSVRTCSAAARDASRCGNETSMYRPTAPGARRASTPPPGQRAAAMPELNRPASIDNHLFAHRVPAPRMKLATTRTARATASSSSSA